MEQPPSKQPKLDIKEMKPIAASFETLPNEIVEISIKMALKSMNTQEKYLFLTEVIPKVSKRLKDISTHKSLWRGLSPIERLPNEDLLQMQYSLLIKLIAAELLTRKVLITQDLQTI